MKKLLFIAVIIVCSVQLNSQIILSGVANRKFSNYKTGDTVSIYGYKKYENGLTPDYIYKKGDEYKKVSCEKIRLIDKCDNYWDQTWFYNRSGDFRLYAWNNDLREKIKDDSRDFVVNIQQKHLFYDDEYLRDYLLELTHKICPNKLNKNNGEAFSLYILKSDSPECFSFDNGTIIISTSALANTKTEAEIAFLLAKQISNVVLEYNIQNLQQHLHSENAAKFWTGLAAVATTAIAISNGANYTRRYDFDFNDAIAVTAATNVITNSVLNNMELKNSADQNKISDRNAEDFMRTSNVEWNSSSLDLTKRISGILTYSAWQQFFATDYKQALATINRIENANIATADDYLLKAKLYRSLYSTEEADYEALSYLQKAMDISNSSILDILKEQGLIYLRIHENLKAKNAFEDYRKGLIQLKDKGEDNDEEIHWVENLIVQNNL